MLQTQGARTVQSTDPRVYDRRCDDDGVALRALVALGQKQRWNLLEELGVEVTPAFKAGIFLLGERWGYAGRSSEMRSESAMAETRFLFPELVPVAQLIRSLYKIVTRLEERFLFA